MILVIDIGNSEIDFGLCEGPAVRIHFRKGTNLTETPDEIGLFLTQMLQRHRVPVGRVRGTAIASVVPDMTAIIGRMLRAEFGKEPFVVDPGAKLPIRIRVDSPAGLGADRVANAVAAFQKLGGPVIVIDCGSATTLSAVNGKGEFLGGAILPGLRGMMGALSRNTAKLPPLPLEVPARFIGRNTHEAMQSGVIHGWRGALEHLLDGMRREMGRAQPTVVATGGLAGFLQSVCPWLETVEPSLTLEGIARIYLSHE